MTNKPLYIAGDWGTSNLRLYLCELATDNTSNTIDTRFGPGISQINGDFENKFFGLTQDWFDQHGALPVILSGMVGSTIGWKEAPYLSCPVNAEQIAESRISFETRGVEFSILPGLRTTNQLGEQDIMRGEELQLLGWLQTYNNPTTQQLFALPGTHNKWVLIKNNTISDFLTAFTGELFALINNNSILVTDQSTIGLNKDVFMQGVAAIKKLGDAQLVHALFATRSKQVLGEMASVDASSYLSGLLIAADVIGATKLFSDCNNVTIIGEPSLTQHYLSVVEQIGMTGQTCDPTKIASAGFTTIYQTLYRSS